MKLFLVIMLFVGSVQAAPPKTIGDLDGITSTLDAEIKVLATKMKKKRIARSKARWLKLRRQEFPIANDANFTAHEDELDAKIVDANK